MIYTFEQRSRHEYVTTTGTEIVKKYFLDPFSDINIVKAALLGGIDDNKRRKPARDMYLPYCYCTDVETELLDERQSCGGNTLGFVPAASNNQAKADFDKIVAALKVKENMPGANLQALTHSSGSWTEVSRQTTGCWITARYKPLVCADGVVYAGKASQPVWVIKDKQSPLGASEIDAFDVVDPVISPQTTYISVPRGLHFINDGLLGRAVGDIDAQLAQAFGTFTLRSVMRPSVPSHTIAKLAGKVNTTNNTFGEFTFPPETLRFRGCDPHKVVVCNYDGTKNIWWDLTFIFDVNWNYGKVYSSGTWNPMELIGANFISPLKYELDYSGWNRILANGLDAFGPIAFEYAPLAYYRVGSSDSVWQSANPFYPQTLVAQYPYAEDIFDDGFHKLFEWSAT